MVRQEEVLFIADHRTGWKVIASGWMLLVAVVVAATIGLRSGSTFDPGAGAPLAGTTTATPRGASMLRLEEPGMAVLSRPRVVAKGFAEYDDDGHDTHDGDALSAMP